LPRTSSPSRLPTPSTTAELQGKIAAGRFYHRLIDVLHVNPILFHSTALLPRAATIIRRATVRIGIYDCLYVALAEREGCEMVTSDKKLIRALGAVYPFNVDLATLP
jgi:predicted nucleic acid-binding protein